MSLIREIQVRMELPVHQVPQENRLVHDILVDKLSLLPYKYVLIFVHLYKYKHIHIHCYTHFFIFAPAMYSWTLHEPTCYEYLYLWTSIAKYVKVCIFVNFRHSLWSFVQNIFHDKRPVSCIILVDFSMCWWSLCLIVMAMVLEETNN